MSDIQMIANNRRARHDYHIEETMEAGIVLQGTEVKSLRLGRVNLRDSFARVEKGEVFLYDMHISPYEQGNRFNHDPPGAQTAPAQTGDQAPNRQNTGRRLYPNPDPALLFPG